MVMQRSLQADSTPTGI